VRQVLDKKPDDVPALMVSALLAERKGAADEAEQTCQKVMTIYPDFPPALRELAILYSRSPRSSDLDKAYEYAEKARAAAPEDLELTKTLGVLAYNHGDFTRSAPLLREWSEKSPNDAEAFYYLGMDYYKLDQASQSKQALQRALDLHVSEKLAAEAQTVLKKLN